MGQMSVTTRLTAPTLKDAVTLLADQDTPPELVLLAQPRPGCDEPSDVERLRRVAPLTRVIVVAGSWCEGELRTGRPLTGVVRLYWYELPAWWRNALAQVANGQSPPWSEALDEIRAGKRCRMPSAAPCSGCLAVDATDFAVFETLAAGLAPFGWNCLWHPRHRPQLAAKTQAADMPITAGLWDGGQLSAAELQSLRQFAHQMACRRARTIALLDFPRVEHVAQAQSAGAAVLMGKPYQVALLHDELVRSSGQWAVGGEKA